MVETSGIEYIGKETAPNVERSAKQVSYINSMDMT